MIFREARAADIPRMMEVRMSVKENILRTPGLVTYENSKKYLTEYGKGWVCELNQRIIGFAIVSVTHHNVWALFVLPEYEKKGIGRKLHDILLDWYFGQTEKKVWLSTAPHTRAEKFYFKSGWLLVGTLDTGELKFEMAFESWTKQ